MEGEQKVCSDLQQDRHIFLNIWGSADLRAACPEGTQQEEQAQGMGTQSASKAGQHQQNHTGVAAPPTPLQLLFQGRTSQTPKAMPTPLPQTSGCRHSCSPPPAPAGKCSNFPLEWQVLQCTWNSIPAPCSGFRAVQSSRVHQVMWSSHITHANKTLNHNCSDPGHCCTLPLGYEIQLITCRACWR